MPIDPAIPTWPRWLAPQSMGWGLTRPIITGPQPLSGRPQYTVSDMGAWRAALNGIRLSAIGDSVRLFRALLFGTLAVGGAVYLPLYDWRRGPRARVGAPPPLLPILFSDTSFFSDAASFNSDLPNITVVAAAASRATRIVVQSAGDPLPIAGEFFGLSDRAHLVTASFPDTPAPGQTTLQFQPPLRFPVTVGDLVETVDPVCRMQLDPKQVETLVSLDLSIVGTVSLDFYESNWT